MFRGDAKDIAAGIRGSHSTHAAGFRDNSHDQFDFGNRTALSAVDFIYAEKVNGRRKDRWNQVREVMLAPKMHGSN
jgi:hypothetical protein